MKLRSLSLLLLLALLSFAAACGSDDDDGDDAAPASSTTTSEAAPAEDLEVLVTNDDGFAAPGIDAIVVALSELDGVKLTVVAPAENQSGSGDATVGGDLVVAEVKTASGHAATSVAGKPADSVIHALDKMGLKPDLVVSGTNIGQNIGPFTDVSGTVGAAKTAARRGIPALAASTGLADEPAFELSADHVVDWVEEHFDDLLAGDVEPLVESLNTPTCPDGDRGVVETKVAADFMGRNANDVNCASTKPEGEVTDDVDAFLNGFTSLTNVPF